MVLQIAVWLSPGGVAKTPRPGSEGWGGHLAYSRKGKTIEIVKKKKEVVIMGWGWQGVEKNNE